MLQLICDCIVNTCALIVSSRQRFLHMVLMEPLKLAEMDCTKHARNYFEMTQI